MIRVLVGLISNLAALLIAEYFIPGFEVTDEFFGMGLVVVLLTLANSIILPIVRFILKPLIWLTLGLLAVAINGALIYAVDLYTENLTISGIGALILATLIFGMVNATFTYGSRALE